MSSPLLAVNFPDLFNRQMSVIYDDIYKRIPDTIGDFLQKDTDDNSYKDMSELTGFGDITSFSGQYDTLESYQGYDTRFDHLEYGNMCIIEQKLIDDDQFNKIIDKPKALALSSRYTRNKLAQLVYSRGFSSAMSSTSGGGTGDALSLYNSAHTSVVSGVANQSNTGTTALTAAGLASARLAMLKYQGPEGNKIMSMPTLLVVPVDLEDTARKLLDTRGEPFNANNEINPRYGQMNYVVGHFLTDTTDWFLVDPMLRNECAFWIDRLTPEFSKDETFNTRQRNYAVYWRHSAGWRDWRWTYGNQVA